MNNKRSAITTDKRDTPSLPVECRAAPTTRSGPDHLDQLNPAQRAAVEYGVGSLGVSGPLLIVAGAGTGKTKTLAHRVAHLILNGVRPERVLLLTFTRRAAAEMTRRAQRWRSVRE